MARRRMIDPNFWQSENIAKLSVFSRLVFIGMVSNADDEGRGRANPNYLKSVIFPYDDIKTTEVEKALAEIGRHTSVGLYEQDGSKYYFFAHWSKWQRVDKPQRSCIPAPEEPIPERLRNDSAMAPESFRTKGSEEKRKEGKRKQEEENSETVFGGGSRLSDSSFTLWESVSGRPITKFEAERVKDLAQTYAADWILDAMTIAGAAGKRKLNYVEGILNNWQTNGKETPKKKKTPRSVKAASTMTKADYEKLLAKSLEEVAKGETEDA